MAAWRQGNGRMDGLVDGWMTGRAGGYEGWKRRRHSAIFNVSRRPRTLRRRMPRMDRCCCGNVRAHAFSGMPTDPELNTTGFFAERSENRKLTRTTALVRTRGCENAKTREYRIQTLLLRSTATDALRLAELTRRTLSGKRVCVSPRRVRAAGHARWW